MWPLKEDGQPISNGGSWWWPYLETWEVYYVPPWLPSGMITPIHKELAFRVWMATDSNLIE